MPIDFFNSPLLIPNRMRRLRKSPSIRKLVQETTLTKNDFVQPLFLKEGAKIQEPIPSMEDVFRFSMDEAAKKMEYLLKKGIHTFALFPAVPAGKKTYDAAEALNELALIPQALRFLKKTFPEACLIADIALDPFTSHGHDGVLGENGTILNDETVEILGKMSLIYAEAGADILAPSDMMDGRIGYIREKLDQAQFQETALLAYSAKFASNFYSPFREAVGSKAALKGDKSSYQLNPANRKEALLEVELDEKEHADILMVKPASLYLDILREVKNRSKKPIAAYHVSGEYAMILAAEKAGVLSAKEAFFETILGIKRAGADLIFTYAIEKIFPFLDQ